MYYPIETVMCILYAFHVAHMYVSDYVCALVNLILYIYLIHYIAERQVRVRHDHFLRVQGSGRADWTVYRLDNCIHLYIPPLHIVYAYTTILCVYM